ncbi:hypothetical protein CDD82_6040 [Ophiocordyceps australis]|uniref:Uncharacterized protein n=1 Tax=Ophiocordyceps australis TaxID=1399860 RepID=A0A2C5YXQ7_9HYPO|nr:hypothetical protein CDD82_6040 [Ophiocordyceps australis]
MDLAPIIVGLALKLVPSPTTVTTQLLNFRGFRFAPTTSHTSTSIISFGGSGMNFFDDDDTDDFDPAIPVFVGLATLAIASVVTVWMVRLIIFWTRLALRVAVYTAILMAIALLWTRGVVPCIQEAGGLAVKALGFLMVVKDVFIEAYARYNEEQGRPPSSGLGRWFS